MGKDGRKEVCGQVSRQNRQNTSAFQNNEMLKIF